MGTSVSGVNANIMQPQANKTEEGQNKKRRWKKKKSVYSVLHSEVNRFKWHVTLNAH